MAGLVIGGQPPLLLGEHEAAALGAQHDLVLGALEVVHVDTVGAPAGGQQRRLVTDVGEVRAGKPGSTAREDPDLHVVGKRELPGVHA